MTAYKVKKSNIYVEKNIYMEPDLIEALKYIYNHSSGVFFFFL